VIYTEHNNSVRVTGFAIVAIVYGKHLTGTAGRYKQKCQRKSNALCRLLQRGALDYMLAAEALTVCSKAVFLMYQNTKDERKFSFKIKFI